MAVYGQFETVAEVGRTRGSAVHRARPADGGWDLGFDDLGTDASYAVKVFLVRTAENAGDDEVSKFLQRARAQKRAADAQAKHWVPIVDAGEVKARGEAYYATAYLPSSAARLAHAPTGQGVDARALHEIVTGMLEGLLELRRTLARPHGNLKPTNVLLRKAAVASITADDVVLTDPAMEEDAVIGGEVEDLYMVGEVIHELVLRRPFPGQHTWPVPASEAWTALGPTGEAWRTMVNRLLSPRAAEHWLRVDDVLDEIRTLQPRGRASRNREKPRSRKKKAAVIALLAIAGAGTFEYFRYNRLWRELCAEYQQWVDPTARALAANTPRLLSEDPYVRERLLAVLDQARRGEIELDPRDIAGAGDQSLLSLPDRAPLSLPAVWKIEKARWQVERTAESLSRGRLKPLQDVIGRKVEYEGRRWARLAQYAQSVADAVPPRPTGNLVATLEALLEGRSRLARLDEARAAARARLDRLQVRADASPLLKEKIAQFATSLRVAVDSDAAVPTSDAVEFLARQLVENERVAASFEAVVGPLSDAARRQRAFEVRGWAGAARHLGNLIDRATPSADSGIDRLTRDLADARSQWEVVQSAWDQIEARRRLLESSGDRMLMTYRAYVAAANLADAPDLAALARALQRLNADHQWDAAARKVASPEWASFDVVAFATKSKAHRAFVGRPVPTEADLSLWLTEVDGHGPNLASATFKPDPWVPATPDLTGVTTAATSATSGAAAGTSGDLLAAATGTPSTGHAGSTTTVPPVKPPPVIPTPPVGPTFVTTDASAAASAGASTGALAAAQVPPRPVTPIGAAAMLAAGATDGRAAGVVGPWAVASQVGGATGTLPANLVPPPPDPEMVRRDAEAKAFVVDCREVGIAATHREIKDAWRARCEQLAQAVAADAKALPAAKASRETLRIRLVQLDGVARSAAQPLEARPVPGETAAPAWRAP
ncbi:MAG TPA: hypothetical protein VEA69_06280, partial [Tepidisphaeraceae bacterium]|nr:hypothetical protein [Tepidisphaeraceae bacterium]